MMTDLSIHKMNIATYELCENLIKSSIRDLHLGKVKRVKTGTNESIDHYLDVYYEHLVVIKQLKNDYLKQNNLKYK